MTKDDTNATLLVREISLDALSTKGSYEKIVAEPEELLAIASDFDLVEISELKSELEIHPWRRSGLRVRGHIVATVVQNCTITLEPVSQSINEPVDRVFLPEAEIESPKMDSDGVIILDADKDETPEILTGPMFNFGLIVLEQLAMEIDPYPKAPGAELSDVYQQDEIVEESPFSALAGLKTEGKD